jgi:bifunctional non-homologous end joining protein LigD
MTAPRQKSKENLATYRRKREFANTPEPTGTGAADADTNRRFVVHEHHARRLHWDLRLEHDGALASWAVPNGIPDDPKRNRKAIHVEDHPLEYIDFAGEIPAGNYGAGEVSVWDRGTYDLEKWRSDEVIVVFRGERLTGKYALFQAGRDPKDWMIHRMDPPVDPDAEPMPEFVPPMLAKLSKLPADESKWAFEVKWDGVRAITRSEPGRIHIHSRNGNEITAAYPELRQLNRELGSHAAMLDGEIIALDADGRPSFQLLQPRMHLRGESAVKRHADSAPVTYMIFDLLWLDGHSLMEQPYSERRERLEQLRLDGERWRVPESFPGQGSGLLAATRERQLEGVVGKRLDSRYVSGSRNGWIKLKNYNEQEVVIGGWTSGQGARAGSIGALLAGVTDDEGQLRYVGRVGTGFDGRELKRLSELLAPIARKDTPFSGRQPPKGSHFVEPELVCEVEFSEWTQTGTLRQPSYKGLRDDKRADEVVRERVEPLASGDWPAGKSPAIAPAAAAPAVKRSATGKGSRAVKPSAAVERPDVERPDPAVWIAEGRKLRGGVEIELEGRTLKLTNPDKVLYPKTGFTKSDLIAYYAGIAPVLLPHLHDRPLTLKRYPDGVEAQYFYEKRSPPHRPDWVQTAPLPAERGSKTIDYTLCQDLPTLVWLANLADIELHTSLSLADAIERPTTVAFDLDPGAPAGIVECCEVAGRLRDLFEQLGLSAFAKTSGSKGLQVYVPLNDPDVTYEQTKPFAHAVAKLLEERDPELIVSSMAKAKRHGKVLIDWSQNDAHKTTVNVYSLRALEQPSVSAPVDWTEVAECAKRGEPGLLRFGPDDVLSRVADRGDLFAKIPTLQQTLPRLEE